MKIKKKRFAAILLVAPLALLAACSSAPKLALESNWFSNTGSNNVPDDFDETLEYAISFEKSTTALNGRFSMNYPKDGTYTVHFTSSATEDGKKTYVYETELKTEVEYYLDGASSGTMSEVVTTYVEFLDLANEMKPLKSWREVHGSAPLTSPSSPANTLDACYAKVDYRMEVVYDHEEEEATFTLTYLNTETANESEVTTIDIDGSGIFFDNEQLIPLLRAAELSTSMSMRTIDPTTRTLDKMTVKDGPTAVTLKQNVKMKADEEAREYDFNANEISISYKKQNSGATHKYTIAQRDLRDSNTYRNVCLKFEYPVIYSQGVLTYRLTAANFYN